MKIKFWLLLVISAISFFSPVTAAEHVGFGMDKIVHFFLFAALAIYGIRSFPRNKGALLALLVLYTLVSEFIQGNYIPHRSFDQYDIIADIVGLAAGTIILRLNKRNEK